MRIQRFSKAKRKLLKQEGRGYVEDVGRNSCDSNNAAVL